MPDFPDVSLGNFVVQEVRVFIKHADVDMIDVQAWVHGTHNAQTGELEDCAGVFVRRVVHQSVWGAMAPRERAYYVRSVIAEALLHELDEWLRVDGEIVNDPHPEIEQATVTIRERKST